MQQVRLSHQPRPALDEDRDYDEYAAEIELNLILIDGYQSLRQVHAHHGHLPPYALQVYRDARYRLRVENSIRRDNMTPEGLLYHLNSRNQPVSQAQKNRHETFGASRGRPRCYRLSRDLRVAQDGQLFCRHCLNWGPSNEIEEGRNHLIDDHGFNPVP